MPIDGKYGKVTLERGAHIPDDEPVIVFRAKDEELPAVLGYYYALCSTAGSPQRHLDLINRTRQTVVAFQATHGTKTPDSETSRAWME